MKNKLFFSGFTLVEMAVSLTVIGFVAVLLSQLYPRLSDSKSKKFSESKFEIANQAITSFVMTNGRLPCPANTNNGVENCALVKGELAYKSLGFSAPISNASGVPLRYALFSKADVGEPNMQLWQQLDRFAVYLVTDNPDAEVAPVGSSSILNLGAPNVLDFCQALNHAQQLNSVDVTALNIHRAGSHRENVAYVLHDSGGLDADNTGGLADANQTNIADDLNFFSAETALSSVNDDRTHIVRFGDLWLDLGCQQAVSIIGHSHANIASASALMAQSMADYQIQIDIGKDVASADIAAAAATMASGVSGVASAAATIPIGISETLNTAGVAGVAITPASVAAVIAAGVGMASATVVMALAIANKVEADSLANDVVGKVAEINNLKNQIHQNVVNADRYGLFRQ